MPTPVTISISMPTVITVGIWQTYFAARQAYFDQCEKDKKAADGITGNYYGAVGLIVAGYAHIIGSTAMENIVKSTPLDKPGNIVNVDSRVIAWLAKQVSERMNEGMTATDDFLSSLADTTPTPSDTEAPSN